MSNEPDANGSIEQIPQVKSTRKRPRHQFLDWRTIDLDSLDGDPSLHQELRTYQRNLKELLRRKGEYVVIRGDEVVDFFPNLEAALEFTADRYRHEPYLIKQVVARERLLSGGGLAF